VRVYRRFSWKGANFRICSDHFDSLAEEIKKQRALLEIYIQRQPAFAASLVPVGLKSGAPPIARRMAEAAELVGVGPMAAVAGAVSQMAVEAGLEAGDREAIVDNGGDIFMVSDAEVVVGLYPGGGSLSDKLGILIEPGAMPLGICSSSSRMGHSLSLGKCDLACVVARNAALADAAATYACNLVKRPGDVAAALERVQVIPGISGVMIVEGERVGLAGDFPKLLRLEGRNLLEKVPRE